MKYVMDSGISRPAYMQLYHQIRNDITGGLYSYGDQLPSKRMLAQEACTSVITVEHAYSILCDEGYAESKERSGYFVIYRDNDCFSASAPDAERTNAAPNHHTAADEAFPFSALAKTMRKVLNEYGERVLIKSPNFGCPELRKAIAAYLARSRGIAVKPMQILIGSGSEYLYGLIIQLLGRENLFAIESPSYEKIKRIYSANGVEYDMLKLGKDGIRTSELRRTSATVLHVTPYNSFPSGITASASKRNEYIRWAAERNGIIIEDDFDSEFTVSTKSEDTVFSLEPQKTVIYLNTFSKTIAPSMRIGYMVLPKQLIGRFQKTLGFYSCTVPIFEQYVLAELIDNGLFERHINRIRRKRRQSGAD